MNFTNEQMPHNFRKRISFFYDSVTDLTTRYTNILREKVLPRHVDKIGMTEWKR